MKTRKAWFCYEFLHEQPVPVIYYDELPTGYVGTKRRRENIVEISHLPLGVDGEYSLSQMAKLYPYPKVLQKETSDVMDENKEQQMARPVTGFQTSQGQFFETEAEADFYEATYEFNRAVTTAVAKQGTFDEQQSEYIAESLKSFIGENEKVIREYLDARAALEKDGSGNAVPVDGQATEDNPTDDTRIRGEDSTRLDEEAEAEAVPETAGAEFNLGSHLTGE